VTTPHETGERLTAQDVHEVAFGRAGMVDRGYDTRQVDAFLDRVAGTIDALSGTVDALNEEIHRIRRWRQQAGAPDEAAAAADPAQVYASARRQVQILTAHAHMAARQVVEQAHLRAAEIIQQARLDAWEIRALASAMPTDSGNGIPLDAGELRERLLLLRETVSVQLDELEQLEQPDHVQ